MIIKKIEGCHIFSQILPMNVMGQLEIHTKKLMAMTAQYNFIYYSVAPYYWQ